MKKIISVFLAFVLFLSSVSVLAACGTDKADDEPEYISEDMRLEHIAKLEEGGVVIAENVKSVHHDEENDVDIVEYTWTVDPAYATPVGKEVSNYSYTDENGNNIAVKLGITNMSKIMENDRFILYMCLNPGKIDIEQQGGSVTDFAVYDKETKHVYH